MLGNFQPLVEAAGLVRKSFWPLVLYGAGVYLIAGVLLAPLVLWILAEVLSLAHSDVIVNYDVAALAFSLNGILLGFLWALVFCSLAVVILGGGVLLIAVAHTGRNISLRRLVRRSVALVPRVPGRGVLKLTLWIVALVPLIVAAATAFGALLLAPFGAGPVEHWLPDEIREIAWVAPAFIALFCLAYTLYVRWSMTLHCLAIERLSLTKALRRSVELVRGSFWPVARVLLLRHVAAALFLGLAALLFGLLDSLTLGLVGQEGSSFPGLVALVIVLDALGLGLAAIVSLSHGIATGTILYFRLRGGNAAADLDVDEPDIVAAGSRRRWFGVVGIFAAFGLAVGLMVPEVIEGLEDLDTKVAVTAHRGSSARAPENTLASVEAAVEDEADFAEIDIQPTSDGTLVLMHDASLKRTTGVDRTVAQTTDAEIGALDAGSSFGAAFEGEPVPTLDDVLALAQNRIELNIELKVYGETDRAAFAAAVVEAIHEADFAGDCVIQTTDAPILAEVRKLDPRLEIGLILAVRVGRIERLDVDFYSVPRKFATVAFIRRAHESGRRVLVWTINDRVSMERFINRGVDSIITDDPRLLRRILDERSEADELYAALVRLFRR